MPRANKKLSKCKWCGRLFEKEHNNQACCSRECQEELTRENSAKSSHRHYHRHKVGNTNRKAVTSLGSKGTSSTCKPKDSFDEEHKSILSEARRIGLDIKKFREIDKGCRA